MKTYLDHSSYTDTYCSENPNIKRRVSLNIQEVEFMEKRKKVYDMSKSIIIDKTHLL